MKSRRSFAALQALSPVRPPNWRWRRAQALLRERRYYSARLDDGPTGRALQFLRAEFGTGSPGYRRKLARGMSDIRGALDLHGGLSGRRCEVEARILARQSAQEIARRMGLPAEAVVAYEALFFHVTDRLACQPYIELVAIGLPAADDAVGPDYARLLKVVGYHGGPLVVDAFVAYLSQKLSNQWFGPPTTMVAPLTVAAVEVFLAAESVHVDQMTSIKLARKWPILEEILKERPRGRLVADIFAAHTDAVVEQLQREAERQAAERQEQRHSADKTGEAA